MATVESDFLSRISGKLGDKNYRTTKARKIIEGLCPQDMVFTDPEDKVNRDKRIKGFGGSGHISSALLDTLCISFPDRERWQSPANVFVAANAKTLCKAESDETGRLVRVYDYKKMVLAVGTLWPALVSATFDNETGTFTVTREKQELSSGHCSPEDKVYVTIFDATNECSSLHLAGVRSESGTTNITVPEEWDKTAMFLYVFVLSKNKKRTSNSKCLYPVEP